MDICTVEEPKAARAVLDPLKNRLLVELREPDSAAGLASRLKMPRQKVNYHLGELEKLGLVTLAEERQWGGLTERRFVARAPSYLLSSKVMGDLATDPNRISDRLSASYLIALAMRLATEVSDLVQRSKKSNKRLATLSIETVLSFRSANARAQFTEELAGMVTKLVSKYHSSSSKGSRPHRLVIGAHPLPSSPASERDKHGS